MDSLSKYDIMSKNVESVLKDINLFDNDIKTQALLTKDLLDKIAEKKVNTKEVETTVVSVKGEKSALVTYADKILNVIHTHLEEFYENEIILYFRGKTTYTLSHNIKQLGIFITHAFNMIDKENRTELTKYADELNLLKDKYNKYIENNLSTKKTKSSTGSSLKEHLSKIDFEYKSLKLKTELYSMYHKEVNFDDYFPKRKHIKRNSDKTNVVKTDNTKKPTKKSTKKASKKSTAKKTVVNPVEI